jgi:hypothetical protein
MVGLAAFGAARTVAWARSESGHMAGSRAWARRDVDAAVEALAAGAKEDPANTELGFLRGQVLAARAARSAGASPAEAISALAEADAVLERAQLSFLTPSRCARSRGEVIDLIAQAHFRLGERDASRAASDRALAQFRIAAAQSPDAIQRPVAFYGDAMLAASRADRKAEAAWYARQAVRFGGPRALERRGLPDRLAFAHAGTANVPALLHDLRRRVLADPANEKLVTAFVDTALALGEGPSAAVAFEAMARRRTLTRMAQAQWDRARGGR